MGLTAVLRDTEHMSNWLSDTVKGTQVKRTADSNKSNSTAVSSLGCRLQKDCFKAANKYFQINNGSNDHV